MPGFIGLPEIILLGLVALILFGPKRLPEMGRGLGKGMREFKESIGGDHGLNESKLDVPTELTTAPTVPEAIAAADRRNAA
jgi:sec-independent protein translocase protein TatA